MALIKSNYEIFYGFTLFNVVGTNTPPKKIQTLIKHRGGGGGGGELRAGPLM